MVESAVPSRTERPTIRPFAGLGPMEALVSELKIQCDGVTNPVTEEETLYLDPQSLEHGVFRLLIPWNEEGVGAAAESASVPLDALDFVVVVDPKLIGPRTVLIRKPLEEVASSPSSLIAGHDGPRSDSLLRTSNGYDVQVAVVLNRVNEGTAVTPRQLGTILAETTFRIRVESGIGSLVFYPLDDEKKKLEGLPKDSLIYLEKQVQPLLEAVDLDSAVKVYVDDRLLGGLERDRSPVAIFTQRVILGQLLMQLLAMGSAELEDVNEVEDVALTDEGDSTIAFGRLLRAMAKVAKLEKPEQFHGDEDIHAWLHLLKHQPQVLFTAATSQAGLQAHAVKMLFSEEEM